MKTSTIYRAKARKNKELTLKQIASRYPVRPRLRRFRRRAPLVLFSALLFLAGPCGGHENRGCVQKINEITSHDYFLCFQPGRFLRVYKSDHRSYPETIRNYDPKNICFYQPSKDGKHYKMKAVGLDGSRGTKDDLPRTAVLLPYACSGDFDGNGKTDVTALLMIAGKKTLRAFHQYPQGSYTETIVEKESTAHDL